MCHGRPVCRRRRAGGARVRERRPFFARMKGGWSRSTRPRCRTLGRGLGRLGHEAAHTASRPHRARHRSTFKARSSPPHDVHDPLAASYVAKRAAQQGVVKSGGSLHAHPLVPTYAHACLEGADRESLTRACDLRFAGERLQGSIDSAQPAGVREEDSLLERAGKDAVAPGVLRAPREDGRARAQWPLCDAHSDRTAVVCERGGTRRHAFESTWPHLVTQQSARCPICATETPRVTRRALCIHPTEQRKRGRALPLLPDVVQSPRICGHRVTSRRSVRQSRRRVSLARWESSTRRRSRRRPSRRRRPSHPRRRSRAPRPSWARRWRPHRRRGMW